MTHSTFFTSSGIKKKKRCIGLLHSNAFYVVLGYQTFMKCRIHGKLSEEMNGSNTETSAY